MYYSFGYEKKMYMLKIKISITRTLDVYSDTAVEEHVLSYIPPLQLCPPLSAALPVMDQNIPPGLL